MIAFIELKICCTNIYNNYQNIFLDLKDGTILIYKGKSATPFWELNNVGTISCLTIGDVCNQKKNSILVFSCSGQCSIFDILTR